MVIQTGDNKFGVAKWIVDSTAGLGTHTTIATALTSASSGDTIFIRPGTYTENITLKAGVNLSAFVCDALTPNVTISGTCTLTTAGTVSISGIRLASNGAEFLSITGSAASIVNLNDCYLTTAFDPGITFSSSSASAVINITNCKGDITASAKRLFNSTSAGLLRFVGSYFTNTGGSATASTISAGLLEGASTVFSSPITTSGTNAIISFVNCFMTLSNTTALTVGGSGPNTINNSTFNSGTASSISIGSVLTITNSSIASSNTNAITGAGAISYSGITFYNTSSTINTTTQTGSGTLQGSKNTAPTAGFLGEQIRSFNNSGQASAGSGAAFNITSITLTPGVWDVSGVTVAAFSGSATQWSMAVSATSATLPGIGGDNSTSNTIALTGNFTASIPSYRVVVSSNTLYYLIGFPIFSSGGCNGFGRISATRVG
jgi:hypothetical protein